MSTLELQECVRAVAKARERGLIGVKPHPVKPPTPPRLGLFKKPPVFVSRSPKNRVRMREIAAMCNCSEAMVSYVYNGHRGNEKIQAVLTELLAKGKVICARSAYKKRRPRVKMPDGIRNIGRPDHFPDAGKMVPS
jgi:hypothetical protein